jgi:hypothetical protein
VGDGAHPAWSTAVIDIGGTRGTTTAARRATAGATVGADSSDRVFHSPHPPHLPDHCDAVAPHAEHVCTALTFAITLARWLRGAR